jgi:hypothetical protein
MESLFPAGRRAGHTRYFKQADADRLSPTTGRPGGSTGATRHRSTWCAAVRRSRNWCRQAGSATQPDHREGRARLLHAIVHIEFSAINLALDHAARFRGLPEQYYADWIGVAADEAYHFSILRERPEQPGLRLRRLSGPCRAVGNGHENG